MVHDLDRVLHQPIRTRIVAFLASNGPTDYVTIRTKFKLTDGHMTTHMRELLKCEYVSYEKDFVDNKTPRTTYKLTAIGKKQFTAYTKALLEIITKGE